MTHHINRRMRTENAPTAIGIARGVAESLLWHTGQRDHADVHPLVVLFAYGIAGPIFGAVLACFAFLLLGVFFPLGLICLIGALLAGGIGLMSLGIVALVGVLWLIEQIRSVTHTRP